MEHALDPGLPRAPPLPPHPHGAGLEVAGLAGGLGTALEEELAMLTRDDEQEEQQEPLERDVDLLALFRQKERDLVLAAKLGKALLERNQDLTKQYEQMNKDLNEKLEVRGNRVRACVRT